MRDLTIWAAVAAVAMGGAAIVLAGVLPGPAAGGELTVGAAALLGVVEGLTEWLPISSTGHLTVTQSFLGIEGDAATSYAIAIQAGAILAVLGLYRHRFLAMFHGLRGEDPAGRRILVAIIVACLPAVVIGLTLEDVIKSRLFGTWPVVVAWLVGGIVILAVSRRRGDATQDVGRPLTELTARAALLVGLAQTLALWPGTSRSLVTILAATAVGLSLPAAVEFSFLLGFVILGGATLYEMASSGGQLIAEYGVVAPVLGLVVALAASVVAMRWMVAYLSRHGLAIFGWYRIAIAMVVAGLLVAGVV